MPITVEAPDGAQVEFPDSMSHDDIEKVMQEHYPTKSEPSDLSQALTPDAYGGRPLTRASLASKQVGADQSGAFAPLIPLGPDIQAETLPGQIAAAPYNVGKGLLEGMESRGGLALLPAGLAGKVGQGVLAGSFGIPAMVEGVKRVYRGTALQEPQEAIEGALQVLTGGGITHLGARGALAKEVPKPVEPPVPPPKLEVTPPPEAPPIILEVPPSVVAGEDKPSAAPVSEAVEAPVTAGATPQAMPEPSVTPPVTQGDVGTTSSIPSVVGEPTAPPVPPGEPPIIQAGAAHVDEIQPTPTALKNASGDAERLGLGLRDAPDIAKGNIEVALAKAATAEEQSPGIGSNLAEMVKRDPKMGLSDVEAAILLRHKVDLFNKMNDAAEASHIGDAKARATAQALHDGLKAQYEDLLDAVSASGSRWGTEGRWRQVMLKEDFTMTSADEMNRYSKVTTGKELPGENVAEAEKKSKAVKVEQDKADSSTAKVLDDITQKANTPPKIKTPNMSEAEKRAFDASNKTVRENAIRISKQETLERVKNAKSDQEVKDIQRDADKRAQDAADKAVREYASERIKQQSIDNAKAENKARQALEVQRDAAQKALDASDKTVRENAKRVADAETKARVAKSAKERADAINDKRVAQKATAIADAQHRQAVIAMVKAQRALQDNPIKAVWDKIREYIEKGIDSPDDIRTKVATDLGMKVDHVTRIMAQDVKTKRLMDEAWLAQQRAASMRQAAKRWVQGLNTPGYEKALGAIPRAFFAAKVFGHGTVALGTHAPTVAFQPRFWGVYMRDFAKMYKLVLNPAFYENEVRDLVRRQNYTKANRGGLVNDPGIHEDFTSPETVKFFGNLSGAGNRGYTILKILRQDMFDQMYNKLPRSLQVQDSVVKALSDDINHSTGVVKSGWLPQGSNIALFAPRLQESRVMQLAGDPIRAARTFADWKNANAGEKMFAQNQIKQKLWIAGTLFSALAANQGLLTAMGSKQKINGLPESLGGAGFDPLASDFLKFKIADHDVAYGSAILNMMKLPIRLITSLAYEGKGSKFVHEDERWYKILGDFARSQASPFAGTAADLTFGRDFQGRPLPRAGFGLLPGKTDIPKRLRMHGITTPYSWTEYGMQQAAPIPVAEFLKEVWGKGLGMSDAQIEQYFKAFLVGSAMAGTGSRITEDKNIEQPQ